MKLMTSLDKIVEIVEEKGKPYQSDGLEHKIYERSFSPKHIFYDNYSLSISSKKFSEDSTVYEVKMRQYRKDDPLGINSLEKELKFWKGVKDISIGVSNLGQTLSENVYFENNINDAYSREFKGGPFNERHPVAYALSEFIGGVSVTGLSGTSILGILSYLNQPGISHAPGTYVALGAALCVAGIFTVGGSLLTVSGTKGIIEVGRGMGNKKPYHQR